MFLSNLISVSMATLLLSGPAFAGNASSHEESMACGSNSITIGMSTDDIKTICGQFWEPAFISSHTRPVLRKVADSDQVNDHFEKWLYRIVDNQETHVVIKNGLVVKIFNTPQP
ncbi:MULTISPECIES: DUF2845 domain-containing protein [unclassified Methylophaga]|jgi:hypothetical protein|uniref:DUF2845 domain-containing protein n=1 Tax=unclassified Methylophaga TaxID=2629249 RepID=UPI000C8E2576|nr:MULTISPECIES: DUF2845 domain-containing protein [unclassified Methylophaga]MAK65650.1 hypothetical protein [Methylophaga sp.]MAY16373.1 hypothetical protein [Methylophaga sp.]MBN45127.1 hypothetical protein [Methylophaga sp.]HAO23880.1 hypothetical protein [Methylophaga sp.]HCD06001.1 hypothetical protein [Methylophaga sp.]|tara:strand:- start:55037 stop:55378 length:342 start_codon:yes stop_codon:yes gene_type:complete